MTQVNALCFGPNLAEAGERRTVTLTSETLEIPGVLTVSLAEVSVSLAGFNQESWNLAFRDCAVIIDDKTDQQRILQDPPTRLREKIEAMVTRQGRHQSGRAVGWALLAMWLVLPVAGLVWFLVESERVADFVVARIPIEAEQSLGRLVWEQTRLRVKELDPGIVATLGGRLTAGSAYTYEWHVVDESSVNAFAIPGGIVVVHSGLITAADSAEELAGVLAHEVQHVERRHSLRALVTTLGLGAMVSLLLGDVGAAAVVQMAQQLMQLKFGRDQELDADVKGFELLLKGDIDPRGMKEFFRKLKDDAPGVPALMSTHPPSDERFARMDQLIEGLGARTFPPLPYEWADVEKAFQR